MFGGGGVTEPPLNVLCAWDAETRGFTEPQRVREGVSCGAPPRNKVEMGSTENGSLPKSVGCTLCSSGGVSGGGGVNGEDGGCQGPASSRFSFCGKSEGTYKVAPSPPENDTD